MYANKKLPMRNLASSLIHINGSIHQNTRHSGFALRSCIHLPTTTNQIVKQNCEQHSCCPLQCWNIAALGSYTTLLLPKHTEPVRRSVGAAIICRPCPSLCPCLSLLYRALSLSQTLLSQLLSRSPSPSPSPSPSHQASGSSGTCHPLRICSSTAWSPSPSAAYSSASARGSLSQEAHWRSVWTCILGHLGSVSCSLHDSHLHHGHGIHQILVMYIAFPEFSDFKVVLLTAQAQMSHVNTLV